jgi:hypothetical protein
MYYNYRQLRSLIAYLICFSFINYTKRFSMSLSVGIAFQLQCFLASTNEAKQTVQLICVGEFGKKASRYYISIVFQFARFLRNENFNFFWWFPTYATCLCHIWLLMEQLFCCSSFELREGKKERNRDFRLAVVVCGSILSRSWPSISFSAFAHFFFTSHISRLIFNFRFITDTT